MILRAEPAARLVAPGVLDQRSAAVVCIQTTRPKYLLFDSRAASPACVVQFGPEEDLQRVHGILQRLHAHSPDLVPKPLGCGAFGDVHTQVQSGLAGAPWFRIQQECASTAAWFAIHARASEALTHLQHAIRHYPEWRRMIHAADELRSQLRECDARFPLSEQVRRRVEALADGLEREGTIEGWAQHGDYALNNLLFDGRNVRTIDFDEFGLTYMPLHDEAGLALSMYALAPPGVSASLDDYLAAMRRAGQPETQPLAWAHEAAFVAHHLLWRMNKSHGIARRDAVNQWLSGILSRLTA
jgi:hypothetical protein